MITLYSKPNCPYCEAAKKWLTNHNFEYTTIDVTQDPEALAFLKEKGHKTVPQLYKGNICFVQGGYDGLKTLGEEVVRKLLEAATEVQK